MLGAVPDPTATPAHTASEPDSATGILPAGFRFGVATAGFQIEGGYNGPGEPANNWVRWERAGRVEPSGLAVDFWNRSEEHLDRAAAMGCDAFRLGVEWARVEPRPGQIDDGALDRYAAILEACRERGMEPLVTLHHFTHPAWLGEDFWLSGESPDRYASWVETATARLGPLCSTWVTLNEINALAVGSYLLGLFPPGRTLAFVDMAVALDHLAAAHVKGYDVIHRIQPARHGHHQQRVAQPLRARPHGDRRAHGAVAGSIARRRGRGPDNDDPSGTGPSRHREGSSAHCVGSPPRNGSAPRAFPALSTRCGPAPTSPRSMWWASTTTPPWPRNSRDCRVGAQRAVRTWQPGNDLWDDRVDPRGLVEYARANVSPGRGVWIVENGLCNRVRRGRSFPRLDGWDRGRYLRAMLGALVDALDAGVPVGAYYHWSLMDNYEWGSYEPRFGIHGIDRERGLRILDTDAMGHDAAGAYRRIIEGLRAGDRSVLVEPS